MKRRLAHVFGLFFFLQIITPEALAERLSLKAFDIESPIIMFDRGDREITAGIKRFTAEVTDNVGIAAVTLFYKNATDLSFTLKKMTILKDGSDLYSVELTLDPAFTKQLQIFIRAEDVSGNSVFEGEKFSPLTYTVIANDAIEKIDEQASNPLPDLGTRADIAKTEQQKKGGFPWWGWVVSAVVIGGVAAGSSGGSGGSPAGNTEPDEGSITVTW